MPPKSAPPSSAKRSPAKTAARPAAKTSARGPASRTARPPAPVRVMLAFREHVGNRRADIGGLALILIAVLAGLGLWTGAGGPFGAFLAALLRSLLGSFSLAAPLALGALGVAIVADRDASSAGSVSVGVTFTALPAMAGWHLLRGAPVPADGIVGLHDAGGLIGYAISRPLTAWLSVPGAWAALTCIATVGVLVLARTSLGTIVATLASWSAWRPEKRDVGLDHDARATVDSVTGATSHRRWRRGRDDAELVAEVGVSARGTDRAPFAGTQEYLSDTEPKVARATVAGIVGELPPVERAAMPTPVIPASASRAIAALKPIENWDDYVLPPMELLTDGRSVGEGTEAHIEAQAQALQQTFEQFKINADVARWSRGPTVTQFEVELGPGVSVKKVTNLGDDIAYALASTDVRIVSPIPGVSAVGVEVPNSSRDLITVGDILRSDLAASDPHPLHVALGVDIAGNAAMINLAKMPHLLVAGATGSGKSVMLNAMIASVIMRARPDQVRMILIDPKQVELTTYNGAPHLLCPVVTNPAKAAEALAWCVEEMEARYETLASLGFRNIESYNDAVEAGELVVDDDGIFAPEDNAQYQPMPYILLVIDELADLMMVAKRDVEESIVRIAQKARAIGIHMVIATQRPSVDVITGILKANIPSRLALMVSSQTDSRVILDGNGAEKLVGNGDMLFKPANQSAATRLQGCFISEREIEPIVEFCKAQRRLPARRRPAVGEPTVPAPVVPTAAAVAPVRINLDDDAVPPLADQVVQLSARRPVDVQDMDEVDVDLAHAADLIVTSGLGSPAMLKRKLKIDIPQAERVLDILETMGVVGPADEVRRREVWWTPKQLDDARTAGPLQR